MTDAAAEEPGWFAGVDSGDSTAAAAAIRTGRAEGPRNWPALAVETGFVAEESAYYDALHHASLTAARAAVREREAADDRQLIHAVRAVDDCRRTANELAERVTEWAGAQWGAVTPGVAGARELASAAETDGTDEVPERVRSLARRVRDLDDEARALRQFLERTAPTVAPNLAALAGPILAARLIALAGGLEALAKLPSGTVQVLGAEDALFAHLQGGAPPPKHGVIYTHEAVRATRPADRGSAARALAGKLTIAARIDHYSGDHRPTLEADLAERIERIRAREDA